MCNKHFYKHAKNQARSRKIPEIMAKNAHADTLGQVRHIAMSGNPVGEVNAAEKHCESGDVVLSSNAWDLCNRGTFKGFEVGDGKYKFFKVKFMTRKNFSPDEFES